MSEIPREPLLRVEGIHTYYGKSHILHGVSLAVGRAEVVGLLGRNGVGKSTTLKAIAGLVQPSQGQVLFEGQSIAQRPAHRVSPNPSSRRADGLSRNADASPACTIRPACIT